MPSKIELKKRSIVSVIRKGIYGPEATIRRKGDVFETRAYLVKFIGSEFGGGSNNWGTSDDVRSWYRVTDKKTGKNYMLTAEELRSFPRPFYTLVKI